MKLNMMNRQVDVDLGSVPSEEGYEGKLVIVLGDQERRESVFLGSFTFWMGGVREASQM